MVCRFESVKLCNFKRKKQLLSLNILALSIVAVSDTYRDDISDGYSIPDEIPTTLAISSVNLCKIDVFTSNTMVLHHKMSQTVKINVNRYTNIYLLMNLFKINQFIFNFSCILALFSFIQQAIFFNHFVFLLLLIVSDILWCKSIIFKVKTSILHQFTWLKASVVGILSGIAYTTVGFPSVVKINWYSVVKNSDMGVLFLH